jgi:hypothetical protein
VHDMGDMGAADSVVSDSEDGSAMAMLPSSSTPLLCGNNTQGMDMGSMTMLMTGFGWSWDQTVACGLFLFSNYQVNSVGMLLSAYLLTFAVALAVQFAACLRMNLPRELDNDGCGRRILQSFLYVVQVALGYVLMLIAMT